ncbi:hypothetical protein FA09DRAFT_231869 [Tilletiopsis washingtonensis]|uniref:Uncharacterized protein n=1 Tax=Tilletiopsis washingtonensis TaxID=58919 RepID=A0A316ZDR9_9BASI|nr:hypothetical protein FA09DRAFT_231869 [Tilletiopsis washingtonensis]PWN99456.1 hypothetical protein FA09DRAFT_231869 [Tilletiopsis washingtonensis]
MRVGSRARRPWERFSPRRSSCSSSRCRARSGCSVPVQSEIAEVTTAEAEAAQILSGDPAAVARARGGPGCEACRAAAAPSEAFSTQLPSASEANLSSQSSPSSTVRSYASSSDVAQRRPSPR